MGGGKGGGCSGLTAAEQIEVIKSVLPAYTEETIKTFQGLESAKEAAMTEYSPRYAAMAQNLYQTYGPRMNEVQQEIKDANKRSDLATDARLLGSANADALLSFARQGLTNVDPQWAEQRQNQSDRLNQLMSSLSLDPKLSYSEQEQVGRAVNQDLLKAGVQETPGALNAVYHGMIYGDKMREKQMQQQAMFANALNAGTNVMGTLRSGIDPVQTVLGRSSGVNPTADMKTLGNYMPSTSDATGMTSSFMGYMSGLNNANVMANRTDSDFWSKLLPSVGIGSSGLSAACCFIFLESYNGQLPWFVRYCRDKFYTPQRRNGYTRLAKFLVPRMQQSQFWRWLVNKTMVIPLTKYGGYYCNVPGFKHGKKYKIVKDVWFKIFEIIGA